MTLEAPSMIAIGMKITTTAQGMESSFRTMDKLLRKHAAFVGVEQRTENALISTIGMIQGGGNTLVLGMLQATVGVQSMAVCIVTMGTLQTVRVVRARIFKFVSL
mmetsp:Transcript_4898/g.7447  ORF Transcript_4898/g.7447 Transcript_4898/m.7447 type:complete len:105 (+) Transcript_4898:1867-2181(+)